MQNFPCFWTEQKVCVCIYLFVMCKVKWAFQLLSLYMVYSVYFFVMQIWDFSSHLNTLAGSEPTVSPGDSSVFNQAPLTLFKHKDEGYALDWSPLVPGRLLSGID